MPIDYGITSGVSIQPAEKLQARGSIQLHVRRSKEPDCLRLRCWFADLLQPVAVIQVAAGAARAEAEAVAVAVVVAVVRAPVVELRRVHGRGGGNDPDVIQAMPQPRRSNNRPDPDADQRESPFTRQRNCDRASCCALSLMKEPAHQRYACGRQ